MSFSEQIKQCEQNKKQGDILFNNFIKKSNEKKTIDYDKIKLVNPKLVNQKSVNHYIDTHSYNSIINSKLIVNNNNCNNCNNHYFTNGISTGVSLF